jgi:hypothetical protein
MSRKSFVTRARAVAQAGIIEGERGEFDGRNLSRLKSCLGIPRLVVGPVEGVGAGAGIEDDDDDAAVPCAIPEENVLELSSMKIKKFSSLTWHGPTAMEVVARLYSIGAVGKVDVGYPQSLTYAIANGAWATLEYRDCSRINLR